MLCELSALRSVAYTDKRHVFGHLDFDWYFKESGLKEILFMAVFISEGSFLL